MEILMSVVAGILFTAAVYLMLSRSLLRIIIGTGLLSHGVHLLILTMGGLKGECSPSGRKGFFLYRSFTSSPHFNCHCHKLWRHFFFLVLAYRAYQELGTDDMDKLRGNEHDE